jgi:hypothetical protein
MVGVLDQKLGPNHRLPVSSSPFHAMLQLLCFTSSLSPIGITRVTGEDRHRVLKASLTSSHRHLNQADKEKFSTYHGPLYPLLFPVLANATNILSKSILFNSFLSFLLLYPQLISHSWWFYLIHISKVIFWWLQSSTDLIEAMPFFAYIVNTSAIVFLISNLFPRPVLPSLPNKIVLFQKVILQYPMHLSKDKLEMALVTCPWKHCLEALPYKIGCINP